MNESAKAKSDLLLIGDGYRKTGQFPKHDAPYGLLETCGGTRSRKIRIVLATEADLIPEGKVLMGPAIDDLPAGR